MPSTQTKLNTSNYPNSNKTKKEKKKEYKKSRISSNCWQVKWFKYLNWIAFIAGPIIMVFLTGEMQTLSIDASESGIPVSNYYWVALYFTIIGGIMSFWSGYWLWFWYHHTESEILSYDRKRLYFWLVIPTALIANFLTSLAFIMLFLKIKSLEKNQVIKKVNNE